MNLFQHLFGQAFDLLIEKLTILLESSTNPWKVEITYDSIAPWMGTHSRTSDVLANTEHKKGTALNQKLKSSIGIKVTHEDLLECLTNPKKVITDCSFMVQETVFFNCSLCHWF